MSLLEVLAVSLYIWQIHTFPVWSIVLYEVEHLNVLEMVMF